MTKLILVRHGQTEWNILGKYQGQTDVSLSAEGIEQAEKLAKNFPLDKVDAVYSSDLSRAFVTAEHIAKRFSLTVQKETAFREIDFGAWEGLTYAEIIKKWPQAMTKFWERPDILDIPGGENFAILERRATLRLNEIIADNAGKNIVVAAHGAINRVIIADALHIDLRYVWAIRQFNTAVNIIVYDGDRRIVELINGTAHLGNAAHAEKT